MSRIDLEYYWVEATTSDFQSSTDESGDITLIKLTGNVGATVFVTRNDSNLWAPQPSTLFYPGSGSSENRGILLVTAAFFPDHGLERANYADGGGSKYPRQLGELFVAAMRVMRTLRDTTPRAVDEATSQLDVESRELLKGFLAGGKER
ncbi:MAG: hypothetical protein QM817_30310 [Archangium sp.]